MLWHIHNWSDLCDWKDSSRTLGPIKLLMTRTKRSLCRCGCSGCLFLVSSSLPEPRGRSRCVFSAQPSSRVTGSVSAPIRATHVPQPRIVIAELSLPSSPVYVSVSDNLAVSVAVSLCICICISICCHTAAELCVTPWQCLQYIVGTVRFRAFYLRPN